LKSIFKYQGVGAKRAKIQSSPFKGDKSIS